MGKVKVNNYILKNTKIKTNKTILCLSDIHGNIKAINNILKVISNFKIDYIFIPGDIVNTLNQKNQDLFISKLIELSKYAKLYITLGNHDFYTNNKKQDDSTLEFNQFKNTNLYKRLNNEKNISIFIDEVNYHNIDNELDLVTMNLPSIYYKERETKKEFNKFINKFDNSKINKNKFNICLVHSPNLVIQKNKIINESIFKSTDFIMCGHNHGGLMPTWIQDLFHNHKGLFGPYTRFIQKNAYGTWNNDNKSLLVSCGVTKISDSAPLKFLHSFMNSLLPTEIELILLVSGNENNIKLVDRKKYKV